MLDVQGESPLAKGNVTATTPLDLLEIEQALSVPIGHAMAGVAPSVYGRKSTSILDDRQDQYEFERQQGNNRRRALIGRKLEIRLS
jgi:hypothetical protein